MEGRESNASDAGRTHILKEAVSRSSPSRRASFGANRRGRSKSVGTGRGTVRVSDSVKPGIAVNSYPKNDKQTLLDRMFFIIFLALLSVVGMCPRISFHMKARIHDVMVLPSVFKTF